jgi:hypothetical protein
MSALPLKADMCSALADVCFVPIADMPALFDHLVGCRLLSLAVGRVMLGVTLQFVRKGFLSLI